MRCCGCPFSGNAFETVYRFNQTNQPVGGGTCIGVPYDESYAIYRRNTRTVTTLMLIEGSETALSVAGLPSSSFTWVFQP